MGFSVFSMHSSKPWILLPLSQRNTFGKELHAVWAETPWASEMWWWYGKLGTSFPRWSLKPFAIRDDFHKLPLWSHTKFQNYACWQEAMPHLQHTQPKLPEAQEAELPSGWDVAITQVSKPFWISVVQEQMNPIYYMAVLEMFCKVNSFPVSFGVITGQGLRYVRGFEIECFKNTQY